MVSITWVLAGIVVLISFIRGFRIVHDKASLLHRKKWGNPIRLTAPVLTLFLSSLACGVLQPASPTDVPGTETPDVTAPATTAVASTTAPADGSPVYFLTGHGEYDPMQQGDRSYSQAKLALEARGYVVSTLKLIDGGSIPEDARLIVIAGPTIPMGWSESSQLSEFVGRGGSLVVLEEPSVMTRFLPEEDTLTDYLKSSWDIQLANDFVIDPSSDPSSGGALEVVASEFGRHEISDALGNAGTVFHSARSVAPVQGTNLSLVELVKTSPQAWAETDLTTLQVGISAGDLGSSQPDADMDLLGPVTLAVAGESFEGSRIVVFGDSDFASDKYASNLANLNLFVESVAWALEASPLASPPDSSALFASNGDWIVFASQKREDWGLYLVRPDGSDLTRLEGELEIPGDAYSTGLDFSWSPDGQMIAFHADHDFNQDIFLADLKEGSFKRLAGTDGDDWFPVWSPDGEWIVFTSKDRIMQVHQDGTGLRTITNAVIEINSIEMPGFAAHPSYSPSGRYLAYSVGDLSMIGQAEIFIFDFESPQTEPSVLFSHPNANDYHPTFAPAGAQLAFVSAASMDYKYDLFFTDLQGDPVKISNHSAQFPFSFVWSPDGNRIAYSVQIGERSEIFVVEPGTGKPVQITGEPLTGETIGYREDGNRAPSWSADSSRIVFQSNRDGNWEIYLMNADGSGQANITNNPGMDLSPSWRP